MIDEEIRDALNVAPSPAFVARVRTRIATEPEPPAWRWSWTYAAAVAMAAAVVIALVLPRTQKLMPAIPQPRIVQGPVPVVSGTAAAATTPATPASPTRSAGAVAPSGVSGFSRTVAMPPKILLDPAETRALRNLIAGVREGRVDLAAAQRSVPLAPMGSAPVTDIVIVPISIDPLAPPPGAEGVRP